MNAVRAQVKQSEKNVTLETINTPCNQACRPIASARSVQANFEAAIALLQPLRARCSALISLRPAWSRSTLEGNERMLDAQLFVPADVMLENTTGSLHLMFLLPPHAEEFMCPQFLQKSFNFVEAGFHSPKEFHCVVIEYASQRGRIHKRVILLCVCVCACV